MQLVLDEDQELLAKTAVDFAAEKSPVARFRALRDARDELGFSPVLWKEMAELGWVGIPLPEEYGGAAMGMAELAVVLEALGRNLAPEPFLSAVLLAGHPLSSAGSDAQKQAWLPGTTAGDTRLTLAHQEPGARYAIHHVATRAERAGDGFRITGSKQQVLDAPGVDAILVPARTAGATDARDGISLFLIEAGAPGLEIERQWRVDSRPTALVKLDGVEVGADALVGEEGGAAPVIEAAVEMATVGLCAEMLGGMTEVFDQTLAYMKEREQFGVRIGTFQALKHRAARVFIELELSRSGVMAAARSLDAEGPGDVESRKLVSLAKARCSDAYVLAANEAVQIFAGVGMTDEYDVGFHMKRARAAELTFGDAAFHRARWAELSGY